MYMRSAPLFPILLALMGLLAACTPSTPTPTPTAPTVSLSASAINVTAPASITLTATASSDRGIATVTFFKNGSQFSQDSQAPYTATADLSAADVPSASFTAQACDPQGLCTTSAAQAVTVNAPAPQQGSFTLTATPPTLSIIQGQSGGTTLSVQPRDGFNAPVTYSVSGTPTGVTTAISGSTLNVQVSNAATGVYPLKITGTGGGQTSTLTIPLTVSAPSSGPDFTLSANPASLTLVQGTSGSTTLTASPSNGFSGQVTYTVNGLPSGVTAAVSGSTVTFTASNAAAPGSAFVTITGTSGSLSHQTAVTLQVAPPPPTDFSLSANPSTLSVVQGGTAATSTITVSKTGGFNGDVALSVTGAPSGLIATLSGTTLSVQAAADLMPGSYPIGVKGTSGSLTHTIGVTVQVTVSGNPNGQAPTVKILPQNSITVTGSVYGTFAFKLAFTNTTRAELYRNGVLSNLQPNPFLPDAISGDLYQFTRDNGTYIYTVKAFNAAGQEADASVTITVNLTTGQDCTANPFPTTIPCTPRNSIEDNWLDQINEIRTKGTLNGTTDALRGTCADPATSQAGHLPAYQYEAHLAYIARQHATYLTQNGTDGGAIENYTAQNFYGATTLDRFWHGGIQDDDLPGKSYLDQINLAQDNNFVQTMLATSLCPQIVNSTYRYIGIGRSLRGFHDLLYLN